MKKLFFPAVLFISLGACAQAPSPPASVSETTDKGVTISINYSQPSVKGRKIGENLEPMEGKVWRTGANKATVFEVKKDVEIEGKKLAAGKYGLFTLVNGDEWTIIFNKTWDQWGAFNYKEADDALRIKVKGKKGQTASEKMTFSVNKDGKVGLAWGDRAVEFKVK